MPGGKLSHLAGTKFNFQCNYRVKSVQAGRIEISSGKPGSCNYHLSRDITQIRLTTEKCSAQ